MSNESWLHMYIDGVDDAYRLSGELQKQALAMAMIKPGVSVFSRLDNKTGGTHFYFPPDMKAWAIQHGASPCQKPSSLEVGHLLFGDQALANGLNK